MKKFLIGCSLIGLSIIIGFAILGNTIKDPLQSISSSVSNVAITNSNNEDDGNSEYTYETPKFVNTSYEGVTDYLPIGEDTFNKWFKDGILKGTYIKYYNYDSEVYDYIFDTDKLTKLFEKLITEGKDVKKDIKKK